MQNIVAPMLGAQKRLDPVAYIDFKIMDRYGDGLIKTEYLCGFHYHMMGDYSAWDNQLQGYIEKNPESSLAWNNKYLNPGELEYCIVVTDKVFARSCIGSTDRRYMVGSYMNIPPNPLLSTNTGLYIDYETAYWKQDEYFLKPGTRYLLYPINSLFNLMDFPTTYSTSNFNETYGGTYYRWEKKPQYRDTNNLIKSPEEFIEHIRVDWSATPKEIYLTPGEYWENISEDYHGTTWKYYGYSDSYIEGVLPKGSWALVEKD